MAVQGLQGARQIKSGFKFSLAVMGDCTLQAWGINNKAELGDGTQQARNHPVPVVGLSEVKEVAIGNAHSMALLYDGTVWTWGASEFGERGNREKGFERVARDNEPQWFVPRDRPTQVPGLSGVKQIASGGTRDFALLGDGEVMAWGDDRGGDLGVQESGESEKCLGETHAITPIPCSTIPRTVMVSPGTPLTRRRTDRGGRRIGLRGAGRGRGSARLGRKRHGPARQRNHHPQPLAGPRDPRTGLAGGGNRRRLDARARAAGERPGVRVGRGQRRPARLHRRRGTVGTLRRRSRLQHDPPAGLRAQPRGRRSPRPKTRAWCSRNSQDATRVIYSFGSTGHYELFGLGNVPYEETPTPTPITSLGSVRALSVSSTTAAALLESGPGPPSVLTATPLQQGLEVTWNVPSSTYKLRYRPVGHARIQRARRSRLPRALRSPADGAAPRTLRSHPQDPRRQGRAGKDPPASRARRCPRRAPPSTPRRPRSAARPPPKRANSRKARR